MFNRYEDRTFDEIKEIALTLRKKTQIAGFIFLVIIVFLLLIIDYHILPRIENAPDWAKWLNITITTKSILINFIPILIIALMVSPVIDDLTKLTLTANDRKKEIRLQKIGDSLEKNIRLTKSISKTPQIIEFCPSYQDLDWTKYLNNATKIDLCFFYSSSEWNRKNITKFSKFLKQGGVINLYLPNSVETSNKFFEDSKLHQEVITKILRTENIFRMEAKKHNTEKLNIRTIKEGFNYMFARVEKDTKNIFIFSPYQNSWSDSQAPAVVIDETEAGTVLKDYIDREVAFLNSAELLPHFEHDRYITWDIENDRVFISTSLSCPGNCKFCYVESIIEEKASNKHSMLGSLIAQSILQDKKFNSGRNGTTILIGGFSDPFQSKNHNHTISIIRNLAPRENLIHISTRYGVGKRNRNILSEFKNISINYSLATFDPKFEINNQTKRFIEAKELKSKGVTVSLYLRPVIPSVTVNEIDKIIKFLKESGITEVTVGGLYIDSKIKAKLKRLKVDFSSTNYLEKSLVLDNKSILKKIGISDIEIITEKLEKNGFTTFESSMDLIDYYRDNLDFISK